MVYGLLWQIIKYGLLSHVNLGKHPELHVIGGEDLATLPAEDLLLRWFNYHLEKSGIALRAKNFGADISDSILYAHLLNRLSPSEALLTIEKEKDLKKRAELILQAAEKMGGREFVSVMDIVEVSGTILRVGIDSWSSGQREAQLGVCCKPVQEEHWHQALHG